jgi:hypothetical protein
LGIDGTVCGAVLGLTGEATDKPDRVGSTGTSSTEKLLTAQAQALVNKALFSGILGIQI